MFRRPKCLLPLSCLALTLGAVMDTMAQARPPQIVYISRDYLKADAVAANRKLERRAEDFCRTLGFTHPYLTIESVSGPAEMWYGLDSQAEADKLTQEYQQNTKLLSGGCVRTWCMSERQPWHVGHFHGRFRLVPAAGSESS
jgi:hypothetical protein